MMILKWIDDRLKWIQNWLKEASQEKPIDLRPRQVAVRFDLMVVTLLFFMGVLAGMFTELKLMKRSNRQAIAAVSDRLHASVVEVLNEALRNMDKKMDEKMDVMRKRSRAMEFRIQRQECFDMWSKGRVKDCKGFL